MFNATINYYVFDSITRSDDGLTWGHKNRARVEVFYLSADDADEYLADNGFAKCDAPDWNETMVVEETAWESIA